MSFLSPDHQCQSSEWNIVAWPHPFFINYQTPDKEQCALYTIPWSRSHKSWAEKHSSRSKPNVSWAKAAKCLSELKQVKKIGGSFFGEQCVLMQNGLSGKLYYYGNRVFDQRYKFYTGTRVSLRLSCGRVNFNPNSVYVLNFKIFFRWRRRTTIRNILSLSLTWLAAGVYVTP